MAKKDDQTDKTNGNGPSPEAALGGGAAAQSAGAGARPGTDAQLAILAQYVKDLSFESPGAPQTLQGPGENPQLQVGVNVNAGPRGEDVYEVVLNFEAHAKSDAGVIYNVELAYAGLFRLSNIPEDMLQPLLFVDCPTLLFPFVRRVLADVVRDGGFPPLMLDPIDFGRLYAQNLARGQEPEQSQPN
jgi:preprotein translocase subunit SecB